MSKGGKDGGREGEREGGKEGGREGRGEVQEKRKRLSGLRRMSALAGPDYVGLHHWLPWLSSPAPSHTHTHTHTHTHKRRA